MKKNKTQQTVFGLMLILLVSIGLSACEPDAGGPRAWIDFPLNGMELPANEMVTITTHGAAAQGIAYLQLSVNGQAYQQVVPETSGATSGTFVFNWLPTTKSSTVIEVITVDMNSNQSSPVSIMVNIVEILQEENIENAPLEAAPPEDNPTATETVSPTLTPTPTATEEATPTATTIPQVEISMQTEQMTITKGDCTRLSWSVKYADQQNLNGTDIAAVGEWQVCPEVTTTYTLRASNAAGNQEYFLIITVNEPADTTAPPIPQTMVPQNGLTIECKAVQNLVWLPVEDASGIDGYFVQLEKEISAGTYQFVQEYGPIIGKQHEVPIDCGLQYRWRVRARDGAGNYSEWSAWSNFAVNLN